MKRKITIYIFTLTVILMMVTSSFSIRILADDIPETDGALQTDEGTDKYDPRPDGVSKIRDQFWGTCWAQAGIAVAEVFLIHNGMEDHNYQLSVEDVLWTVRDEIRGGWIMRDRDASGFPPAITGFLMTAGVRLESDIPYLGEPADGDYEGSLVYGEGENQKPVNFYTAPLQYEITGVLFQIKGSVEEVKELIRKYGAIGASYRASDEGFNPETSAAYEPYVPDTGANHSIAVIGWDDSFPKENFNERDGKKPEHDGAWIIKNSFGENYGSDGGFIYISYEDGFLFNEEGRLNYFYAVTGARKPLGQKRYYYDQYGSIISINREGGERSVWANVYDFGKDERINELSFVSWSAGCEYQMYYAPMNGDVPDADESKWILLSEGIIPYAGYTTVSSVYEGAVPEGKGAILFVVSGEKRNVGTDEPGYNDGARLKYNNIKDENSAFELIDGSFKILEVERELNSIKYIEQPDLCIRAYTVPYESEDDYYYCKEGDKSIWQQDSSAGLQFIFDRSSGKEAYVNREGIMVDGRLLSEAEYDEKEGSWIVNLKPSYLSGLSVGDHTLEASFKDYEEKVKAVFTIKAKEEKHEDEEAAVPAYRIPATGIHD